MSNNGGNNIFHLLLRASEKREMEERARLLQSMGVKENFDDGRITIDWKTCRGVDCRLCIDACPTNALYWREGEIGIDDRLCVYCVACVGVCVVDDCILVIRKRPNGEIERFSNSGEILTLLRNIHKRKVVERAKSIFPDAEAYLKRYG